MRVGPATCGKPPAAGESDSAAAQEARTRTVAWRRVILRNDMELLEKGMPVS